MGKNDRFAVIGRSFSGLRSCHGLLLSVSRGRVDSSSWYLLLAYLCFCTLQPVSHTLSALPLLVRQRLSRTIINSSLPASTLDKPSGKRLSLLANIERGCGRYVGLLWSGGGWNGEGFCHEGGEAERFD